MIFQRKWWSAAVCTSDLLAVFLWNTWWPLTTKVVQTGFPLWPGKKVNPSDCHCIICTLTDTINLRFIICSLGWGWNTYAMKRTELYSWMGTHLSIHSCALLKSPPLPHTTGVVPKSNRRVRKESFKSLYTLTVLRGHLCEFTMHVKTNYFKLIPFSVSC